MSSKCHGTPSQSGVCSSALPALRAPKLGAVLLDVKPRTLLVFLEVPEEGGRSDRIVYAFLSVP